jgi:RNA-dependent RNA polymerase
MQSFHGLAYPRYVVNVRRKCLCIYFKVGIRGSEKTADVTQHDYRIKLTFLQLTQVYDRYDPVSKQQSLLIILNSASICHRRANDPLSTLIEERNWNEEDSWYRQTAVTHNPHSLRTLPTTLKKPGHIIDLGKSLPSIINLLISSPVL